jgi:hypothetical protein
VAFDGDIVDDLRRLKNTLKLYDFSNNGRAVFRELLQNADDAAASWVQFHVLDEGIAGAKNSLLHGPALVVINDGPFYRDNLNKIRKRAGTTKSQDVGSVGRFGMGQKSIFHLCEAWLCIGSSEKEGVLAGHLNPWAPDEWDGEHKVERDPDFPDWVGFSESDQKLVQQAFGDSLSGNGWFLLWIPLRLAGHIRPEGGRIIEYEPTAASLSQTLDDLAPLGRLLPQLAHLRQIEFHRHQVPGSGQRLSQVLVAKGGTHLSRPVSGEVQRRFAGSVDCSGHGVLQYWGTEAVDEVDGLIELQTGPEWPQTKVRENGRIISVPEAVISHGAATVSITDAVGAEAQLTIDWCVFLPMADHTTRIPIPESASNIWIRLHGYFFPDHGRRKIMGFDTHGVTPMGQEGHEASWNSTLRDAVVLPCLLEPLVDALPALTETARGAFLRGFERSDLYKRHRSAICRKQSLIWGVVGANPVCLAPSTTRLLPVPQQVSDEASVIRPLLRRAEQAGGALLVIAERPRLTSAQTPVGWTTETLQIALGDGIGEHLTNTAAVTVLREIVESVEDSVARERAVVWLVKAAFKTHGPAAFRRNKTKPLWQRMVSHLVQRNVLPTGAHKAIPLTADLDIDLLILPKEITTAQQTRIDLETGRVLLRTLAAAITEKDNPLATDAGLLAAEVVAAMGTGAVMGDETLKALPIFRVWSACTGGQDNISPARLIELKALGLAFRGLGGFQYGNAAALYKALNTHGLDVVLVDEQMGEALGLGPPSERNILQPLIASQALALTASPAERQALLLAVVQQSILKTLQTDSQSADAHSLRHGIRYVLHGDGARRRSTEELWKAGATQSIDNAAARLVFSVKGEEWRLLSETLTRGLNDIWLKALDIKAMGRLEFVGHLGGLNEAQMADLAQRASAQTADAILLATAEHPDVWKRLPLHLANDGRRVSLVNPGTYLWHEKWPLPDEMTGEVNLIRPATDALQQAEQQSVLKPWSPIAQVETVLLQAKPAEWALQCLTALQYIPEDDWDCERLRAVAWLPVTGTADNSSAKKPGDLLGLTPAVASTVAGILSGQTEAFCAAADVRADVRAHSGFPSVIKKLALQGSDLIEAIALELEVLQPEALALGKGAAALYDFDVAVVSHGLGKTAGWRLLQELDKAVKEREALITMLLPALSYEAPREQQIALLNDLSDAADTRMGENAKLELQAYLSCLEVAGNRPDFVEHVLPHIRLPTRAGEWAWAREIARTGDNLAPKYRLSEDAELVVLTSLEGEAGQVYDGTGPEVVCSDSAPSQQDLAGAAEALRSYFEPLFRLGPRSIGREAAGLFVMLLGEGHQGCLSDLARQWLTPRQPDIEWDWIYHQATTGLYLAPDMGHVTLRRAKYAVRKMDAVAEKVGTISLLGTPLSASLASAVATDTLFAGLDAQGVASDTPRWLRLLPIDAQMPQEERYALLARSIESFVSLRLRRMLNAGLFGQRWAEFTESGQVQLAAVRENILDALPIRLEQLNYKQDAKLRSAVAAVATAKNRLAAAEATFGDMGWAEKIEVPRAELAKAKHTLVTLVESDQEVQQFLLEQVRKKLTQYQYNVARVTWEILQNADDAVVQLFEMIGSPEASGVSPSTRFRVETSGQTLRFIHWGRQINQHAHGGFRRGQERGWDQDLRKMMVLNTSDKDIDQGTTGRFGLGYKSVYLLTDMPRIGSGQLAFSVTAGMLPNPLEQNPVRDGDHAGVQPPTVFELDISEDGAVDAALDDFRAFGGLATLFSRRIDRVELVTDDGRFSASWRPTAIPVVSGAFVGNVSVQLCEGVEPRRLFLLRDSDGETSVVLQMSGPGFGALSTDIPSLWVTAPTLERWQLGIVINAPFGVDVGRSQVALKAPATEKAARVAGTLILKVFGALHEALGEDWAAVAPHLGLPPQRTELAELELWKSLWQVLAKSWTAVKGSGEDRPGFIRQIHGQGRGLTGLVSRYRILPSGLSENFDVLTRIREVRYLTERELEEPKVLKAIDEWDFIGDDFGPGKVVSERIFDVLNGIDPSITKPQLIGLCEVLDRWGSSDGKGVSVGRAEQLHVVVDWQQEEFMRSTTWQAIQEWMKRQVFPSSGRHGAPSSKLLLPPLSEAVKQGLQGLGEGDRLRKLHDEMRRAEFAPDDRVLAETHAENAQAVRFFLACRQLQIGGVDDLTGWARSAHLPRRQEAALRYCIESEFGSELGRRFRQEPLQWMPDRATLVGSLLLRDWSELDKVDLRAALFPDRTLSPPPEDDFIEFVPRPQVQTFFDKLDEWWSEPTHRDPVLKKHEQAAWPDWLRADLGRHLEEDSKEHWLALLVLGACQSLGRSNLGQHRQFLNDAKNDGSWDTFSGSSADDTAWMDVLRKWQDASNTSISRPQWVALFPSIFHLRVHLSKYRKLLKGADRRTESQYKLDWLLTPRADENMGEAGSQFDAPASPLNMGLHWVLRELVRLRVIEPKPHLLPDCWVPSDRLIRFLRPLGLDLSSNGASNPDKAHAIHRLVSEELHEDPHLHRSFDIPLLHIAMHTDLQRKLGLEG